EQPPVLLERPGRDAAQDAVLSDALHRRLRVVDGVAGARVQQPVVASGGARGQLAPLQQGHGQSAQRQVVGKGPSGAAATDHEHVRRVHVFLPLLAAPGPTRSRRRREAPQRAISTGRWLRCRTLWATLPSSSEVRSPRPWEPMTIRPATRSSARWVRNRAVPADWALRSSARALIPASSSSATYLPASSMTSRSIS